MMFPLVYTILLSITGPPWVGAKHGTPAERGSHLSRTRLSARSQDVYTQHKVGPKTETEQLFKTIELFQPLTPLKGADIGPYASQQGQQALLHPTRGSRVKFSEESDFKAIPKHSLVHGDGTEQTLSYKCHICRCKCTRLPAAQWYARPNHSYTAEGAWIESHRHRKLSFFLVNFPKVLSIPITRTSEQFFNLKSFRRPVAPALKHRRGKLDADHPPASSSIPMATIHHIQQAQPQDQKLEYVFMMGEDTLEDFDSRKYRCRPFDGTPGRPFEIFCRDFGNAFSRDYIGDSDLTTCMLGLDIGGYLEQNPNTDRSVFGGVPMYQFYNADGTVRAGARQQLMDHTKRKRILFSYLMEHISNSDLREMLTSQAQHDGAKAYQLLHDQCHQEVDDLTLMEHDSQWDNVSLLTVGINEHSISNLITHLHSLNAKRPSNRQKSKDQLVIKVLSCITPDISESLAHTCQEEIAAAPSKRKFWTNNQRDILKLKADLQPLWRIKFNQGAITIPKESGRRATGGGARPDASYVNDSALLAKSTTAPPNNQPQRALLSASQALKSARCYRCQGSGHQANICPTPADHSVTIHDWIAALQSHAGSRTKARSTYSLITRPRAIQSKTQGSPLAPVIMFAGCFTLESNFYIIFQSRNGSRLPR
mmetsp:Transcript_25311/g.76785  ORF Transcript_25311/g.76785 Transcript_25311/m.76785 type:complete len:651 (-) Transcript_25311:310-2262(-)